MTNDAYYHRGPVTVCMPVSFLFDRVVRKVIGPLEPPFRVLGVTYDYDRDEATVDYEHPPTGPRTSTWPEKVIGFSVDRALVVEAIARTARVYSRRINRATGQVMPVRDDWATELRHALPAWFNLEFECNAGWADLLRAMSEWLWELGMPEGFRFLQVKEKFAGLRAYASVRTLTTEQVNLVRARIDACEAVSFGTCEQCGEPGKVRETDCGWFYTACDRHA